VQPSDCLGLLHSKSWHISSTIHKCLYGLHISNAPNTGGGGEMSRMIWVKVIAQQLISFIIVLNKMMLNRKIFFAAL